MTLEVQALGKKLKRRTLKRPDWQAVRRELRSRQSQMHPEARHRIALVVDRHAPTLYDTDPLALRASFMERFGGGWGHLEAARHMIRVANGLPGVSIAYPHVGPAFTLRGYYIQSPIAKLPDARRAA